MAKKIIQDIYVVKKSIRMIKRSDVRDGFYSSGKIIPKKEIVANDFTNDSSVDSQTDDADEDQFNSEKKVTKDSLIFLWAVCIVSIGILLFLLSSTFSTATLTITPQNKNIVLNDTYNITSDTNVSTSTLHFEVMTIKKDLFKTMETDGEEYVERKATGKAVIYNNLDATKQRLINNTRLETKEGLTYRIRQSVDVPGVKIVAGVKTPGSVEVEIIADMPGDKYNMKLSDFKGDFTIPGFKGSTKYTTFYARLSADVSGGFIGNIKKVSDDKIAAGLTVLKETLKNDLIKEIFSKKPEQFVLFKNNYYIQCIDLPNNPLDKEYKISEECSMNAIIFNKDSLSFFIAKNKIDKFDNSKVDILWNDSDSVQLTGSTEKPWNETNIKALFTGSAQVVWTFDAAEILSSIIGQDKSIINAIIDNNKSSISEIQATIRPMWSNTFPKNTKKIDIVDTVRDSAK